MNKDNITTFRLYLSATILASAILLAYTLNLGAELSILSRSRNLIMLFGAGTFILAFTILLEIGFLLATWTSWQNRVLSSLDSQYASLKRLGIGNLILFALAIGLLSLLLTSPYNRYIQGLHLRLTLGWLLGVAGAILLKASGVERGWGWCLVTAFLLIGAGYRLTIFALEISTYPFSLGWSEASRYYYASLFTSEKWYGMSIPPSILHPSRYLMQAVPFLLPNSPLWLHRSWQVFLWLVTTLATIGLLVKRLEIKDRYDRLVFFLWASSFLLMAPVYYHLQITIILVLWGYNRRRPWQTMTAVLVASVWAGISRINWIPVPGMLAASLYFLETAKAGKAWHRYLTKPSMWVLAGSAIAFLSQEAYAKLSGNPAELFGSSLSSELLWYRLLPNATYPLGILPGALLVIIPGIVVIALKLAGRWKSIHLLRVTGISAIMFVLFAGGLVVSVKIGGGSNLHNIDAFLCLLLIVLVYLYFDKIAPETTTGVSLAVVKNQGTFYEVALAVAILVPVIIILDIAAARNLPNQERISQALTTIQAEVDAAADNGGKVLFISERQLLIFNSIKGAEMVPDYEKVFLMEMAMASNSTYLGGFYKKLADNEFALIVSEPLKPIFQDRTHSFGEENNAWVERVAQPILCYYEPKLSLREVRTELLIPRENAVNCP